jgi:hypothetical protein
MVGSQPYASERMHADWREGMVASALRLLDAKLRKTRNTLAPSVIIGLRALGTQNGLNWKT